MRSIFERVSLMHDIEYYKRIFDRYGGMMYLLGRGKVFYQQREKLIEDGYVESSAWLLSMGES